MIAPALLAHPVGRAFDSLAENYDEVFTCSLIGRAQRDAVWGAARAAFTPGSRILEINCGTGEDALFLARQGVIVFACDASEQMIAVAKNGTRRRHLALGFASVCWQSSSWRP